MLRLRLMPVCFVVCAALGACSAARAQSPAETTPPENKRTDPQQSAQQQPALEQQRDQTAPLVDQFAQTHPTASELKTVASVLLRNFAFEEYQFHSAAEVMPADKYGYRPAEGNYGGGLPRAGPKEDRTLGGAGERAGRGDMRLSGARGRKKTPP